VTQFPEPGAETAAPAVLFGRYLDFYRETVIRKVTSLSEEERHNSRLPSGWTPLGLLFHLACMERRWFVWGFLGEDIGDPWPDAQGSPDQPWRVPVGITLDAVVTTLREVAGRTGRVLEREPLDRQAPPGPRFTGEPATLAWICFHVLQEYARHAGHLDIAVELAGGPLGE
jgi:uncharacterized damage-inducible protein DinB